MTYYLPGMGGRPRDTADEDERDRTFNELIGGLAAPAADELGSDPVPKLQVQNFDPAPEAPAEYGAHASPPPNDPPVPSDMEDPPTRVETTGRSMQDETPTPPPMAAPAGGAVPRSKYADLEDLLASRAEDNIRNPKSAADTSYHEPTEGSTNWAGMLAPLAAIALDAGVNHGRGAGQIVGAAGANYDADRRQQLQHAEKLAELDAHQRQLKQTDPLAQLVNLGNLDARDRELVNVKEVNAGNRTRTTNSLIDPNSTEGQGRVDQVGNIAYARKDKTQDAAHDNNTRTAGDRAEITTAVTGARNAQNIDDAPALNKVAADKAVGTLEATSPQRIADAGAVAGVQAEARDPVKERDEQRLRDQKIADLANPATPVGLGREKEDRAAAQQYTDKTKFGLDAAQHVKTLEKVLERYKPGELPGVGFAEGRLPDAYFEGQSTLSSFGEGKPDQRSDDALQIRRLQSAMSNAIERPESGAAIGLQEDAKYLMRQGAQPGATEQEFRQGLDAYKQTLITHLTTNRVGKEQAADKVLGAAGITPEWLGQAQSGGKQNPVENASHAADGGGVLPVTPGAGPKVSSVVNGPKGPGLDANGLSTDDSPTKTFHYRSRKTGQVIAVQATDAEKAARPGLEWVD